MSDIGNHISGTRSLSDIKKGAATFGLFIMQKIFIIVVMLDDVQKKQKY